MKRLTAVLAALTFFGVGVPAANAAYPVYPSAPPAVTCSTTTAVVSTWQTNVNTAASGTTQCISNGSYATHVIFKRTAAGTVTAASVSGYGAVLSLGLEVQKGTGGGITMQGLEITNSTNTNLAGDCFWELDGITAAVTLQNSKIHNCYRSGFVQRRPPCTAPCAPTTGYSTNLSLLDSYVYDYGNGDPTAQGFILRGDNGIVKRNDLSDNPNDFGNVWGDSNQIISNYAHDSTPFSSTQHPDFVQSWQYVGGDGAQGKPLTNAIIERNRTRNIAGPNAHFVLIEGAGASGNDIRSNEVIGLGNSGDHGIILGTAQTAGDVLTTTIEGNVFYNAGRVEFNNSATGTLKNNIFRNCIDTGPWVISGTATVTVTNNTGSGVAGCTATGTNAANRDPLFVNPATFDFHLQALSPEKETGTGSTGGLDIDDGTRVVGTINRGSDET